MGIELLEIGVKMRKGVIFTIRGCFKSVCNHPFLVGFLCFLILLYRSSPFIFKLLVSASPILICTAVLLGVLLSYGEPNIPEIEIEIEEKTTFEAVSMKIGVLGDAAVVEQNGSYFVERFSEKREDLSDDTALLITGRSCEIESNGGEIREENRELDDSKLITEWIGEKKLDDHVLESDDDKSEADSFDSEKVNVDSLDSPPRSPWKRIQEREEEEEERAEEDDASGSDRAESSSPDASMADIMPMLDELHPLLDDETPQPVRTSHSGSDVASEKSSKLSTKSCESDDESEENHDHSEAQDDDNEDDEDARGDKEDRMKSVITWTEEDEKNLMDLGSSEIERNQRLENLILRRRARKNMSMVPERNLIDLESADNYPFGLAPISTTRQNPFDLPQDSLNNNSGLPPIPGSAPSVLLQRRNPFDIPYDSSEEKPNLMGDGFKEEFMTSFQSRKMIFRRHESFNVGPSLFAPGMKDVRMRPYFVPEGTVLEESSYSSFQRQSGEPSESEVSSVPETESIGSVEDLEGKKLSDEDNRREIEEVFEGPSGVQQPISHQEEEKEDVNREPELISEIENVSEHVGYGIQSSEDEESLELDQDEKREVEVGELEVKFENVADHYQQESAMEVQATEYHANYEGGERVYRRDSRSSSLSEANERVFTEIQGEGLSMLEERRDGISTQTTTESTNMSISGILVVDVPQRDPVYDSSPRGVENNISSLLISSVGRESEWSSQEIETGIPSNVEILHETLITHPVDEHRPMGVVDIREHDNVNTYFSEVEKESEIEISQVSIPLKSSVEASVEENLVEKPGLGEVSDSRADESILNFDKSSEDQFEVSEPLFEGQLRGEDTIGMEERETVRSPDAGADAYQRADEKLISMSSVEGNTYPFHVAKEIHEPNYEHLDEVQASNALVESSGDFQITPNLNMPEVQELDHDIPLIINSPLSPEFTSNPSSATETTDSHVNVQTTIEEVDDIKEIEEELLYELDNVGDLSVAQWGSGSIEFKKRIDSVEESSAHQIKTSTARVADVDSVEENKIENVVHLEKSREDIDIEEKVEYISKLQTSKTNSGEHIDSSVSKTSENETLSNENEARPVHSVVSHDYEDSISEIPELEVQSKEKDVDFVSEKDESTSLEIEITYQGQIDTDTTSRKPELEVSTIEDIDLAIKEITAKEMGKPVILDPPQAAPVVKETLAGHSKNGASNENSSVMGTTHETSVLEVGPIEKDATLDSKQSLSDSVDRGQEISSVLHVAENVPTEGKMSRSSSSSSSSSSESSSSDSERK